MEIFVNAEKYITKHIDPKIIARLYKAKTVIYRDIFEHKAAYEQAKIAANYYLIAKDTTKYLNTINDITVLCQQLKDKKSEDFYLSILTSNIDKLNTQQVSNYYALCLNQSLDKEPEQIKKAISEYIAATQEPTTRNWLFLAKAYINLKEYSTAFSVLNKHTFYNGKKDVAYYWIAAQIYEALGQNDKALSLLKTYINKIDTTALNIFHSDTKFIEERVATEIKSVRHTYLIIIISLSLVIIVLALMILSQRIHKVKRENQIQKITFDKERKIITEEKKETERMLKSLKSELNQLKKISKDKFIDKSILASVEQRLNVLNMFILAEISTSFENVAIAELKKLMGNRDEFLESTRNSFMVSHPKFITYLQNHNLTKREIGCCCLYCIGFKSSEVSEYLQRKAIYNVNSIIRQKLDISKGDKQINTFLKQKMDELDS